MKRAVIFTLAIFAIGAAAAAKNRNALAMKAEETFFRALNKDASLKKSALRELTTAAAADPMDARTSVLLGLCHLWAAAEGSRTDPDGLSHLILSEHYLARAQELDPSDERIPSWLVPARMVLASFERKNADSEYAVLLEAFKKDPGFHSFSVGLLAFDSPRDSERFRTGLNAVRQGLQCQDDDPSCGNRPKWPHNREAFNLFVADFEMKAGEVKRAREALLAAKAVPELATWRHANEVEDRLANVEDYVNRYGNADANDDPPRPQTRCSACHAE